MSTLLHRSRFWLAAISFVALTAGARSQTPASDQAWPKSAITDPTTLDFTKAGLDAVDARLKQSVADGDTAGMTFILLRHGQVADFKSVGQQTPDKPMALDSLFRIYSMSKPVTGVAMMQLYEPGTRWSYSVAVDIQGYLVQKMSGRKFGDYLKERVTGPIGMTDTAFGEAGLRRPRGVAREADRAWHPLNA